MEVDVSSRFKAVLTIVIWWGVRDKKITPYPNEFAACKFRIIVVMSASSRPPKRNA